MLVSVAIHCHYNLLKSTTLGSRVGFIDSTFAYFAYERKDHNNQPLNPSSGEETNRNHVALNDCSGRTHYISLDAIAMVIPDKTWKVRKANRKHLIK